LGGRRPERGGELGGSIEEPTRAPPSSGGCLVGRVSSGDKKDRVEGGRCDTMARLLPTMARVFFTDRRIFTARER
jgi:hypothetical protein